LFTFAAGGAVDIQVLEFSHQKRKVFWPKNTNYQKTAGWYRRNYSSIKAKPDGYQLLALTSDAITNNVTKKVDYQIDSFDPVIMFTYDPATLSVYANGPYSYLDEILKQQKQRKYQYPRRS
jgi:tripartite-type tricarboxylate transporter receptor subunit TctC